MVIFANEYHRQIPQHSHIKCFMQHTLPCSAIAKIAKHHIFSTTVTLSKSQTCAGTYLCAYNTMTAKEIFFKAKKVHTATFTLAATGSFTVQLSHTAYSRYTFCNS